MTKFIVQAYSKPQRDDGDFGGPSTEVFIDLVEITERDPQVTLMEREDETGVVLVVPDSKRQRTVAVYWILLETFAEFFLDLMMGEE